MSIFRIGFGPRIFRMSVGRGGARLSSGFGPFTFYSSRRRRRPR